MKKSLQAHNTRDIEFYDKIVFTISKGDKIRFVLLFLLIFMLVISVVSTPFSIYMAQTKNLKKQPCCYSKRIDFQLFVFVIWNSRKKSNRMLASTSFHFQRINFHCFIHFFLLHNNV